MPLCNRVTPSGELTDTPERGLMMGNRGGRIHGARTKRLGRRRWASRQWIICVLEFNGRHRTVWGNSYTELFFVDEVTALAAGHRPCFECRRQAAKSYAAALTAGLRLEAAPRAPEIDRLLHGERLNGREKRNHSADISTLPDGAMIERDGAALAVRGERLLAWSPAGYGQPRPRPPTGIETILTPPATIAALAAGYRSLWHPSAD